MTTFAELQALTIELTRRPELVTMTKMAIRTATTRAHCTDFFHRDSHAAMLTYTPSNEVSFADVTDVYASIPRLRGIKFVQCVNPINNAPTENLTYVDIDDVYNHEGRLRPSVYTLRGTVLRLYPLQQTGKVDVHCFLLPSVVESVYSSWIANDYPEEIATWAAAIVLHRTGNLEQAQNILKQQVQPFRELLIETYHVPSVS
jgi:hypothetical protein